MEITYRRIGNQALVARAEGTIDERNARQLMDETGSAIDAGARLIVLDCTGLRYVTSYGLGALVRIHKRLAEREGRLVLAAVGDRLLTLLRLVRLEAVFPMYGTVDEALAGVRS